MFFLSNNNIKEIQVLNSEKIKAVVLLNWCDYVVLLFIKKKKLKNGIATKVFTQNQSD